LFTTGKKITFSTEQCNTPCLKNVQPLACYNFDTRERILIFLAQILPIK